MLVCDIDRFCRRDDNPLEVIMDCCDGCQCRLTGTRQELQDAGASILMYSLAINWGPRIPPHRVFAVDWCLRCPACSEAGLIPDCEYGERQPDRVIDWRKDRRW